ncbi:peptidylprolyl isomerase [Colwellia sp. KU-HH00111]|uniref:peptidylprolyl isomerase n=1 Tax=Colwellia sp. KU-HH00111 TaxID=3127652 RepID=UPI00336536EE
MLKTLFSAALLFLGYISIVDATVVEFKTSQGAFQVNLFDQSTPKTVENFLNYVDEQHYTNAVIHRVALSFVVQGGGFTFEGDLPLTRIDTNSPVINEPVYSNVKGTIAMAKLANNPDSATDQWFFNLANNANNLDKQNGGFTVFGQVIGDGMKVIEKIAQLQLCDKSSNGDGIPVAIDSTVQRCADISGLSIENFVVIEHITIIDSSSVTDADLSPTKNTLLSQVFEPEKSSSGGAMAWLSLFVLFITAHRKLNTTIRLD